MACRYLHAERLYGECDAWPDMYHVVPLRSLMEPGMGREHSARLTESTTDYLSSKCSGLIDQKSRAILSPNLQKGKTAHALGFAKSHTRKFIGPSPMTWNPLSRITCFTGRVDQLVLQPTSLGHRIRHL